MSVIPQPRVLSTFPDPAASAPHLIRSRTSVDQVLRVLGDSRVMTFAGQGKQVRRRMHRLMHELNELGNASNLHMSDDGRTVLTVTAPGVATYRAPGDLAPDD